jgi:glc operon protein GlcG
LRGIAAAEGNDTFYGQGAVPIFRQGVLIGACGLAVGAHKKTRLAPARG